MSVAYVDTSVSTAIAFDEPSAAAPASRNIHPVEIHGTGDCPIARPAPWMGESSFSYPFSASRLNPSRVCGNLRPRMRDATTVRRICAVPPPMVNIRASRAMRSSGRLRE